VYLPEIKTRSSAVAEGPRDADIIVKFSCSCWIILRFCPVMARADSECECINVSTKRELKQCVISCKSVAYALKINVLNTEKF